MPPASPSTRSRRGRRYVTPPPYGVKQVRHTFRTEDVSGGPAAVGRPANGAGALGAPARAGWRCPLAPAQLSKVM